MRRWRERAITAAWPIWKGKQNQPRPQWSCQRERSDETPAGDGGRKAKIQVAATDGGSRFLASSKACWDFGGSCCVLGEGKTGMDVGESGLQLQAAAPAGARLNWREQDKNPDPSCGMEKKRLRAVPLTELADGYFCSQPRRHLHHLSLPNLCVKSDRLLGLTLDCFPASKMGEIKPPTTLNMPLLKRLCSILMPAACAFALCARANTATNLPVEWIDPDTGHRVVQLSREPGSESLYFNLNPSPRTDGRWSSPRRTESR